MQFKNNTKGFTVFELIIGIAIITILVTFLTLLIRPQFLYAQTRDKKRISDISTLERIVVESKVDSQTYPGTPNTTYYSNILPSGSLGPLSKISQGWLGNSSGLTVYNSKLPLDPLNNSTYRYVYRHNGASYEINAVLEAETSLMGSDGGDDVNVYELGNDLTLL